MKAHTIVPVEEYLSTVYRPDCDHVDGVVEERNVGENDHAHWQREILFYLRTRERELGIYIIQEQRVQIGPSRFRVPGISVMLGGIHHAAVDLHRGPVIGGPLQPAAAAY
jgi:hypothetical protein